MDTLLHIDFPTAWFPAPLSEHGAVVMLTCFQANVQEKEELGEVGV